MISFSLTSHAKVVVSERNVHLDWIQKVLDNPARTEADMVDPELQHSLGIIAEHGDRVLRVVHSRDVPTRIITAYFDRSLKGKL